MKKPAASRTAGSGRPDTLMACRVASSSPAAMRSRTSKSSGSGAARMGRTCEGKCMRSKASFNAGAWSIMRSHATFASRAEIVPVAACGGQIVDGQLRSALRQLHNRSRSRSRSRIRIRIRSPRLWHRTWSIPHRRSDPRESCNRRKAPRTSPRAYLARTDNEDRGCRGARQ